jgi:hypothetical protein
VNDQLNISIISFSLNHIHGRVEDENGGDPWFATGIYGFPEESKKKHTWSLIKKHTSEMWLCFGDLNDILIGSEKQGGNLRSYDQLSLGREIVEICGLSDLGFIGYLFTWSNGKEGVLDWAIAT